MIHFHETSFVSVHESIEGLGTVASHHMTQACREDPSILDECAASIIDGAVSELRMFDQESLMAMQPFTRERIEAVIRAAEAPQKIEVVYHHRLDAEPTSQGPIVSGGHPVHVVEPNGTVHYDCGEPLCAQ